MEAHANWEHHLLSLAGQIAHPTAARPSRRNGLLRRAYARADRITAAHSRSFYLASALLPGDKRPAVRALYAFCRTVDDLVDEPDVPDREVRLRAWHQVVDSGSASDGDWVAAAWADTLTRHRIPRHYAHQLIDGVARDLVQSRYETFEELATYCYAVASTVGLMSMYILGFENRLAAPYAIKLGVALQMTNILRDVSEDYRNGRLYLPQQELREYGIPEWEIAEGHVTDRWRSFMRFQINRARRLYDESRPGLGLLEPGSRMAVAAASVFYEGILKEIEKRDFDVFRGRASVSAWGKISRLPGVGWKLGR